MPDTVSTILVMGPPRSGKSGFIELLTGPIKLQPNGQVTNDLRSISISPYFDDGEIIRLVKFPGFEDSKEGPTDSKLFMDLVKLLHLFRRRGEPIKSIIYLHPMADDMNVTDVGRNVTMLQHIAGNAIRNVIIVTTKWERIPESDRNSKEGELRRDLMQFYQEPFVRYDGTKLSALIILNLAKKKAPKPLALQTELEDNNSNPSRTKSGAALAHYLRRLIRSEQNRENDLDEEKSAAESANDWGKVDELTSTLRQLEDTLALLRKRLRELEVTIDWGQATTDIEALERAIKARHDSAIKDWKAEYEKVMIENSTLRNKVADYESLRAAVENLRSTYKYGASLSTPIRALSTCGGYDLNSVWSDWIGFSVGETLYTNGQLLTSPWGDLYLVRNSARRVGVVYASYFTKV